GKAVAEAADAGRLVGLVEEGIELARTLARGLYPVEMEAEGLMRAFGDLAGTISQGAKVRCVFECDSPVLIQDNAVATHLYRIAQEAVRNAVRHAKARRIGINLVEQAGQVKLTVEDDGVGMLESSPAGDGLGVRIMAYRAALIGGTFNIEPAPTGGTMVTCAFPKSPAPAAPAHAHDES
ncbi:MAG: histidine kinase, partial [Verrucomicrobia bacterium]|nr:histidine kinase [Verrucomicrobiota bacterium]